MAFDFSKLNIFKRLNARSRIIVLVGAVAGLLFLVYLATKIIGGGEVATGASSVAAAPAELQSVQGGALTPEYYRALQQANVQAAKQASMTGGSAIPTLIRVDDQNAGGSASCIICSDDFVNIRDLMDDWVKQGKMSPELEDDLLKLANTDVVADMFAIELDKLIKEEKLTPDQARQLLERYKKQHLNVLLQQSAKFMDELIKQESLSIDDANELLATQKKEVTVSEYANKLQQWVDEEKISSKTAQQLLEQYSQVYSKEVTMKSIAVLQRMANGGQLTPEVFKDLVGLETQRVPLDQMADSLKTYVNAGKMIPAISDKILEEYQQQKAAMGTLNTIHQLQKQAEDAAFQEISDLLKAGTISSETAAQLSDMIQQNIPFNDFKGNVDQLVQQKKLSPEIAKLKIGDYTAVKSLREMSAKLTKMQANDVSASQYSEELNGYVNAGTLTPDQAGLLLREYQNLANTRLNTSRGESSAAFAESPKKTGATGEETTSTTAGGGAPDQFSIAESQANAQAANQEKQAQIQALSNSMLSQAQQLISSWQPPSMQHVQGTEAKKTDTPTSKETSSQNGSINKPSPRSADNTSSIPLVKAGNILFAVLDTTVNSDYPDSPVMATIVTGAFKGSKLLGKLVTAKGVSGQMDRVSLNFTLMNRDDWTKSRQVTAYAIDPDTARTVLASNVDYHYLQRFGAMFATSFLQGYASAITSASSTNTTGIFGTTTTYPPLSPSQKLAVALGQVGQTVGQATQNYVNRPPTVKVDSGVSLGILFMADVT